MVLWGSNVSALLCAPAAQALPTSNRVVWFDRSDSPALNPEQLKSDWAPYDCKGQCRTDEYLAGIVNISGGVGALLCRPLA